MNNLIISILSVSILFFSSYVYNGSTTASVSLAGAIIKAKHVDVVKKYKRKDCPICEGKGWYISGDQIEKVNCGYCETDKAEPPEVEAISPLPPSVLKKAPSCANGNCPQGVKIIRR